MSYFAKGKELPERQYVLPLFVHIGKTDGQVYLIVESTIMLYLCDDQWLKLWENQHIDDMQNFWEAHAQFEEVE